MAPRAFATHRIAGDGWERFALAHKQVFLGGLVPVLGEQ